MHKILIPWSVSILQRSNWNYPCWRERVLKVVNSSILETCEQMLLSRTLLNYIENKSSRNSAINNIFRMVIQHLIIPFEDVTVATKTKYPWWLKAIPSISSEKNILIATLKRGMWWVWIWSPILSFKMCS